MPLLLLDSDVEDNDEAAREVTDRLYGGGSDHRLQQEMLLGIGGVRALRLCSRLTGHPAPEVYHTNEGHAGFLGIERIRELVSRDGLTFDEALEAVRAGTVFTTHTPVPAGIDRFARDQIELVLRRRQRAPRRARSSGCWRSAPRTTPAATRPCSTWPSWACGSRSGPTASRSCTAWSAARCSTGCGRASTTARCRSPRSPTACTRPTWVDHRGLRAGREHLGSRLTDDASGWDEIDAVPDRELWEARRALRDQLVHEARRRLRASWLQRGASRAELGWIDNVLDPDILTIGFARRVPTYKRLTLMLRDPERLERLLLDPTGRCRSSSPASRTRPTTAASGSSSRSCGSPTTPRSGTGSCSCPTTTSAMAQPSTRAATSG